MQGENKKAACLCEVVDQIGYWDGVVGEAREKTGGPRVQCKDCGVTFNLTWQEWEKIPAENKTALGA